MSTVEAKLIVRRGPNPDHIYNLADETIIVGRERINDVVFADPEVSRRHARILWQEGSFLIEDLNSTNGTFVNGRRIETITKLSNGDIVDFGETIRVIFEQAVTGTLGLPYTQPATSEPISFDSGFAQEPDSGIAEAMYDTEPPFPVPKAAPATQSPLETFDSMSPLPPHTSMSSAAEPENGEPQRRLWLGIGCGALVLMMGICFGVVYLLDLYYPNLLYGWLPF